MTPAARFQAAIEVLDRVLSGTPAEQALTGWARGARYAGSKDRAAVRDHVFQALRCRRSYAALGGGTNGRAIVLGQLRSANICADSIFSGEGYAPAPLSEAERKVGHAPDPGPEALDLPDWLWPHFVASLGEVKAAETAQALQCRAPVTLRVNTRMSTVLQAIDNLQKEGILTGPVSGSPTALIVHDGARRINFSRAYAEGQIELQDAASQMAMDRLEIPPGSRVLDYCAGGGGKTLAMAARVRADWFAHDAAPERMRDLSARAARAGVSVSRLTGPEVEAQAPFDVILCDVPCSGSGTWRRAPDAKWRLTEDDLARLGALQDEILDQAQALVRPGGCLAYATCSVLDVENETRVQAFLARHPGWRQEFSARWDVLPEHDGFYLSVFIAPEQSE